MNQRRILITPNYYDDELFTESFVNLPAMDLTKASSICLILNTIDPQGFAYYKAVALDYVPKSFEP